MATRSVVLGILTNILLAGIKFTAGFLGNSYALIADAIESTTDIFSSFLVWLGIRYSTKPPDKNHPYGHGRAEALITFVIVIFLVLASLTIAYQSIINIQTPHAVPKPYTLIVLVIVVAFKEVMYRVTLKRGKKVKSSALKAEAWHHRSDAITSVLAFLGISVALLFGEGYEIADDIAALLASVFILYNAYRIFRPALGEIMDEHTHHEMESDIRQIAEKVPGVENTEKFFIRKVGMVFYIDLHVRVDANKTVAEGHEIAHQCKAAIKDEFSEIGDVMIHIEPAS
ncbi:MAG: cation transporter [Crocinitomicaceae bacterium]|nr:cation transporter [Crocinitomicaceae bacterium]